MKVSQALWCDTGNHAFSSKDPNKKRRVEETESEDKYGDTKIEQEEFYTCGECDSRVKKIFSDAGTALAEKNRQLEAWQEGFQTGQRANPSTPITEGTIVE